MEEASSSVPATLTHKDEDHEQQDKNREGLKPAKGEDPADEPTACATVIADTSSSSSSSSSSTTTTNTTTKTTTANNNNNNSSTPLEKAMTEIRLGDAHNETGDDEPQEEPSNKVIPEQAVSSAYTGIENKDITRASAAKEEGNRLFRDKEYDQAIQMYTEAIALCPEDEEHRETLSIFLGNRAAAYFAVEEYHCVVDDCTESLKINPNYIKVLMRRSQGYEKMDKPEEAREDAKKVAELDPSYPKIHLTVKRLDEVCEKRFNKLKDEALDKLKGLGNSILGNFGMSLDNFKMEKDPKTGSYSISMQR